MATPISAFWRKTLSLPHAAIFKKGAVTNKAIREQPPFAPACRRTVKLVFVTNRRLRQSPFVANVAGKKEKAKPR